MPPANVRAAVVTTVIPVYNRPRLLTDAVTSVLEQTYRPIEILIVDDGSTDETPAIARAFADSHPEIVRYLRQDHAGEPYAGCARARNAGLAAATGEFIQLLDSDDILMPEKFATQVSALRANAGCGISYCYVREYPFAEPWPGRPARRTGETFTTLYPELVLGRIWPSPSPLFRRDVVEAAGPFRELVNSDWEFECRTGALGVQLHHCRAYLADVRNTHRLEGRRQPSGPRPTVAVNATAHELMLDHARRARVPGAMLDRFARRLFALARQCAEAGFEDAARRCLELAIGAAAAPATRRWLMQYGAMSDRLGWQRLARPWESTVRRWMQARWWCALHAARWRHRAGVVFDSLSHQPATAWPRVLGALWVGRSSRGPNLPKSHRG
jgi:hypothetical protein